jgi:hypothetical protein
MTKQNHSSYPSSTVPFSYWEQDSTVSIQQQPQPMQMSPLSSTPPQGAAAPWQLPAEQLLMMTTPFPAGPTYAPQQHSQHQNQHQPLYPVEGAGQSHFLGSNSSVQSDPSVLGGMASTPLPMAQSTSQSQYTNSNMNMNMSLGNNNHQGLEMGVNIAAHIDMNQAVNVNTRASFSAIPMSYSTNTNDPRLVHRLSLQSNYSYDDGKYILKHRIPLSYYPRTLHPLHSGDFQKVLLSLTFFFLRLLFLSF